MYIYIYMIYIYIYMDACIYSPKSGTEHILRTHSPSYPDYWSILMDYYFFAGMVYDIGSFILCSPLHFRRVEQMLIIKLSLVHVRVALNDCPTGNNARI